MPLPRARAKYGYHLWLFSITRSPMPRLLAYVGAWTWHKAQSPMSQLIIHCSFISMLRPHAVCFCQVERACNCHQLITFYKLVKKVWVLKTPHSTVVKVFFELSACHKTKPLCKIWLWGVQAWPEHHCCHWIASKVKHSESAHLRKWARDHLQELPLQGLALPPPGPNISCKTNTSQHSLKLLPTWQTFTGLGSFPQGTCIVDGYDLILTASPVAPTTDLKGDWTSTCHQTRRKAQLFSFSPCHNSKGASPGEIWREQHSETTFQFTFCTGKSHLWDDIWSRRGANFAVVCT